MIKYITIALFILVTLLSSCKEAEEKPSTEELLKEIKELELNMSKKEDPIAFWKNMLNQGRYAFDGVVKSQIHYNIAKNFASINIDSAEFYVTKALISIEDIKGYEHIKLLIYNGLGNTSNIKGNVFLSSFYYNKIVAILEANPLVATPNETKIQYYLHSAQANTKIGLHENAFELNKKAQQYLSSSIENYFWFRTYSQLFASGYYKRITADSLEYYLKYVEKYSETEQDKRFYYEHKAKLLELREKFDSAKLYFEKVANFEQKIYKKAPKNVNISNIYISYCHLLENSVDRKQLNEARLIIQKIHILEEKYKDYLQPTDSISFWNAMASYYYQIKSLDSYKKASNSVIDLQTKIHQKAELQAKEEMHTMYQLKENKKAIKELNQDVEVKENQLQQTQFLLIITALGILVALAILALFYYRQKNQKLQQEYEKVVLEQKLLRTQMEPHFIFNTLSTLQSLIRFQEPKVAIDYLNKFSRLLRSNLELSRKELISLEDEIETIQNYLQLQQARFKEHFTYEIQTPDELEIDALLIPPMLIQPFVENSILHGFDGESEWHIEIKITELTSTGQLQIDIIDNGVGIHDNSNKKHKSLSGEIAKERLEILSKKYKTPTDYQIFSEHAKGTTVSLKLPIIDMSNE